MIPFYFAYDIEAPLVDAITISRIVTYLLIGAGIIAVIIIIYSAFLMVTAAGEPEKFKSGRQALTAAVIGLLIALLGVVIIQIVIGSIG